MQIGIKRHQRVGPPKGFRGTLMVKLIRILVFLSLLISLLFVKWSMNQKINSFNLTSCLPAAFSWMILARACSIPNNDPIKTLIVQNSFSGHFVLLFFMISWCKIKLYVNCKWIVRIFLQVTHNVLLSLNQFFRAPNFSWTSL